MKAELPWILANSRIPHPTMGLGTGFDGAFHLVLTGRRLQIIASKPNLLDWDLPGPPWEHVSVTRFEGRHNNHTPTWEDMSYVKSLFWEPEETVIQFHPPQSRYVNHHPHVLHLWKPIGLNIPMPPLVCV